MHAKERADKAAKKDSAITKIQYTDLKQLIQEMAKIFG